MAPVPLDRFGMLLAIALPVIPVCLSPLPLTGAHVFRVRRIVADSFAVILTAAFPLALRLAANALFRSINRWLENLLAVAATPARPHAPVLFSSDVCSQTSKQNKSRRPAEYRKRL